jgi:hypothetical protein
MNEVSRLLGQRWGSQLREDDEMLEELGAGNTTLAGAKRDIRSYFSDSLRNLREEVSGDDDAAVVARTALKSVSLDDICAAANIDSLAKRALALN